MWGNFLKRLVDFMVALILILILLPLFILVTIIVLIDSPGPVFFVQERVGKELKPMKVYKFRTMTNVKREVKPVIGKAEGVTRSGYFLRRFKIDELPQLFNIFKGEMSLVGPRPSIFSQLDNMTEEQKRRYSVRPGLTGLAQVSGNIHISWPERFKYDLYYVNNLSFLLDLRIFIRTFLIVIVGEEKFVNSPLIKVS